MDLLNALGLAADGVKNSNLSLYIGRVVLVPDSYEENGILYVDLDNMRSQKYPSNVEEAEAKYTKSRTGLTLHTAYKAWHNPPRLNYRGSIVGNGSISINNYMFDPQMIAWMTLVSVSIKALTAGVAPVVETMPWQVSLTEISGMNVPQVDLNPSEIVTDSLNEFMEDLFTVDLETSLFEDLDPDEAVDALCDVLGDNVGKTYNSIVQSVFSCLIGEDGLVSAVENVYGIASGSNGKEPINGCMDGLTDALRNKYLAKDYSGEMSDKLKDSMRPILSSAITPVVDLINDNINEIKEPVYQVFGQIQSKLDVALPKIKTSVEAALNALPLDSLPNIVKFLLEKAIKPLIKKVLVKLMGKAKDLIKDGIKEVVEKLIKLILSQIGINSSSGSLTKAIFCFLIKGADFATSAIGKCLTKAMESIELGFGKVVSGTEYLRSLNDKLTSSITGNIDDIQSALNAVMDKALQRLNEYRDHVLEVLQNVQSDVKQYVLEKVNRTFGNALMLISKLIGIKDVIISAVTVVQSLTDDSMALGSPYSEFIGNAITEKVESSFDRLDGEYSMDIRAFSKDLTKETLSEARGYVQKLSASVSNTKECLVATFNDVSSAGSSGAYGDNKQKEVLEYAMNLCKDLSQDLQDTMSGLKDDCIGIAVKYVTSKVVSLVADKVKEAVMDELNPIQKILLASAMKSIDARLGEMETYEQGYEKGKEVADVLSVTIDNYMSGILGSVNFDSFMEESQGKLKEIANISGSLKNLSKLKDAAEAMSDIADKIDSATGGLSSGISSSAALLGIPSVSYSVNTGNDYSAHFQSDEKSQLPWCQSILSQDLIKKGSIVLMASVGNSMDNLYVIDLLPSY